MHAVNLVQLIPFENKEVYLMGNFNINLLNYESNQETADFLNNMHSKYNTANLHYTQVKNTD